MKKLSELNRSRWLTGIITGGIFILMLTLNVLTPYICDDFTYRMNFMTKEPLGSVLEIFESMYAHSYKMNGRLISHGLAQVFMLLPPLVFDMVNAAVFTMTLLLVVRLCTKGRNAMLYLGIFCLIWTSMPVFGQVALWQVGAVNYFWSLTALVIFITPELLRLREGKTLLHSSWHWAAFCVYAFFFGWYNEIASFVGICMIPCLILLDLWFNRTKVQLHRLLPVAFAVSGYIVMLSMPAQAANKTGALTLSLVMQRFMTCTLKFGKYCTILLLITAALNIWGLKSKIDRKHLIIADLLALAGICANYMPIAASYYPERCMCTTVLLLIMAIAMLSAELLNEKGIRVIAGCTALLILVSIPIGIYGCRDILSCHRQHIVREKSISSALENGEKNVIANIICPETPWSGYYGLRDLVDDPQDWPNHSMAQFYGLDSLIGK